uniref:Copper transporter n=1 Tax=Syphacia muris TaxID=451379 RepID=A0A0N5AV67_9BILA
MFLYLLVRNLFKSDQEETTKIDQYGFDEPAREAMENVLMMLTGIMKLHYFSEEYILFFQWHAEGFLGRRVKLLKEYHLKKQMLQGMYDMDYERQMCLQMQMQFGGMVQVYPMHFRVTQAFLYGLQKTSLYLVLLALLCSNYVIILGVLIGAAVGNYLYIKEPAALFLNNE